MSQLLQVATRGGGSVPTEALNPTHIDQGIPFTVNNLVAVEFGGGIDHYHQGLPFTAGNRLAAALNAAVTRVAPGGAPFTAAGLLAFGNGAVDHFSTGIPYTAAGQIKT